MKQTAVEWLQEALEQTILTHEQEMQTIGLFEQAKAMEKEQMNGMFDKGFKSGIEDYIDIQNGYDGKSISFEQYYNETFKSE